jgi:hypothetical protein
VTAEQWLKAVRILLAAGTFASRLRNASASVVSIRLDIFRLRSEYIGGQFEDIWVRFNFEYLRPVGQDAALALGTYIQSFVNDLDLSSFFILFTFIVTDRMSLPSRPACLRDLPIL